MSFIAFCLLMNDCEKLVLQKNKSTSDNIFVMVEVRLKLPLTQYYTNPLTSPQKTGIDSQHISIVFFLPACPAKAGCCRVNTNFNIVKKSSKLNFRIANFIK